MAELTLCELCGKENAAVFVTKKIGDSKRREALCLRCAEKQQVPSVREFLEQQKEADAPPRLCGQCGELPAAVFVSVPADGNALKQEALCVFCARERGIPAVTEMLEKMQISDEELRKLHADILSRPQEQKAESLLQRLRRRIKSRFENS